MPTYSYRCPKCGREYDKLQKISDNKRAKCPKCGARGERMISGGVGFVFKGSGFYTTDYKRAGEKKPSEEPSKKAAAESKSTESKKSEPKKGADS